MKVFKVVAAYGLEAATVEGWELVHTLATSRADKVQCLTPLAIEGSAGYNGGYPTAGHVDNSHPREEIVQVNEPVFLLSKDREVVSREEALAAEMRAAKAALMPLEERSRLDQRDIAELTKTVEARNEEISRVRALLAAVQGSNHTMEINLAKIRTAIGTVRFDEILAP